MHLLVGHPNATEVKSSRSSAGKLGNLMDQAVYVQRHSDLLDEGFQGSRGVVFFSRRRCPLKGRLGLR